MVQEVQGLRASLVAVCRLTTRGLAQVGPLEEGQRRADQQVWTLLPDPGVDPSSASSCPLTSTVTTVTLMNSSFVSFPLPQLPSLLRPHFRSAGNELLLTRPLRPSGRHSQPLPLPVSTAAVASVREVFLPGRGKTTKTSKQTRETGMAAMESRQLNGAS